MRARPWNEEMRERWDWGAVGAWLLPFGLVAFLGLEGGGYDSLVHDQVGIAVWWLILATALAGALPRRRLGKTALASLILLGAFVLWVVLSLIWTDSADRTFVELSRDLTYLGVFAVALGTRDSGETSRLLGAVTAGIVLVVGVGLISRLHPGLIADAQQTGRLLEATERLSYPLNYWNGLACITAIGIPLLLQFATGARSILVRALCAAAIPAFALTLYFTISRGGIAAAAIAIAIFLALAADRLPKLVSAGVVLAGAAVLVLAGHARNDLRDGLETELAKTQGDEMLVYVIVVGVVVAGVVAGLALLGRRTERPAWSRPSKQASGWALGVALAALVVFAFAIDAPGKLSDGWDEFKNGGGPGSGTERLGSVSGEARYELWGSALDQFEATPLIGEGAGSFQFWWASEGPGAETVRDAHSLYLQTLGELGILGLLPLLGFLGLVFVAGVRNVFLTDAAERSRLAAALAAVAVFAITAMVDWMWQMPVLPVTMLLLASALVVGREARGERPRLALGWRLAVAAVSLVAIALIAISLSSLTQIRKSEADVRGGDLAAALDAARSAQNVQPYAAAPRLQQALVLELLRDYGAAEAAARAATERERKNWRNWLVLSRIAAENGRPGASVAAYKQARSLNPHALIFLR
ncbi:MAG: hypothetical protein QOF13_1463 [Solirubrobacterales bacterium]|nr:hypothetical protein [Solirubrobacterales bacterium]